MADEKVEVAVKRVFHFLSMHTVHFPSLRSITFHWSTGTFAIKAAIRANIICEVLDQLNFTTIYTRSLQYIKSLINLSYNVFSLYENLPNSI